MAVGRGVGWRTGLGGGRDGDGMRCAVGWRAGVGMGDGMGLCRKN